MRITVEEHPEAIKRYAHVRPPRGSTVRVCSAGCPGTRRTCTLEIGHRGPHVAHGRFRRAVAVWDSGGTRRAPVTRDAKPPPRKSLRSGTALGLRSERPTGFAGKLWERLRGFGSLEEIAFLLFFVAFVGFAVHWLMLILG